MKIILVCGKSKSVNSELVREIHENPEEYEPITEPDIDLSLDVDEIENGESS